MHTDFPSVGWLKNSYSCFFFLFFLIIPVVKLFVCVQHECNTGVPRPAGPAEAVLRGCHPAGEQRRGCEEQTEDHLQVIHRSIAALSQINKHLVLRFLGSNWLVVLPGAMFQVCVCVCVQGAGLVTLWCFGLSRAGLLRAHPSSHGCKKHTHTHS